MTDRERVTGIAWHVRNAIVNNNDADRTTIEIIADALLEAEARGWEGAAALSDEVPLACSSDLRTRAAALRAQKEEL